MWFEQEYRWRADCGSVWIMPLRLRNDARFLISMRHERMFEIVRIFECVGKDKLGPDLPVESSQLVENTVWNSHGIVTHIEENHLGCQNRRGATRLLLPVGFDSLHRHSRLAPEFRGLATLSE